MAITSVTEARDAILTLFKTAWDSQGGSVPVVVYDDDPAPDPNLSSEWIRVAVQHTDGEQATMGGTGNRKFSRYGQVFMAIHTKVGTGRVRADALAETANNIFEGAATGLDDVWFRNVRIIEAGSNGIYTITNVIADFTYDRHR